MTKFYFKILTCIIIAQGGSSEVTDQINETQEEFNGTIPDDFLKEENDKIDHSGDYSGDFSGDYSGDFSSDSSGEISGDYSGDLSADYSGEISGDFSGDFSGDYSGDINEIVSSLIG